MSATQPLLSANSTPPTTAVWKRFRVPLGLLLVFSVLFAIPWIWNTFDDEPLMPIVMLVWWAPFLAVISIGVWWLFFSGLRWVTRLSIPLLLALAVSGFSYSCVRKFGMDMKHGLLVPTLEFVWDDDPEEAHEGYLLQQQTRPVDAPPLIVKTEPEDFPRYRGRNADGVVSFLKLHINWKEHPPQLLWRHPGGGGYSGVAVAGQIAVTLEQWDKKKKEAVVCYDRGTGKLLWHYSYDSYYKDVMGNGPRATPTIHKERIFTLGATGELLCLNTEGKKQWSVNILQDSKAKNVKWGLSGSPLIVDDLVVVNAGIDEDAPANAALVAYEQATGKKRWQTGNRKAGYSSPQLATLKGTRQILLFDAGGLSGYDPKTGKELWHSWWVTIYDMNSIQPVVIGDDRVFISSEKDPGCALLRLRPPATDADEWQVETVWYNKDLAARYANPVSNGKHIFGLHHTVGVLRCLDAETGNIVWDGERYGPGQLLLANNALIVVSDKGNVSLVATDLPTYKELARFTVFDEKTWNTPALAGDQLFLRNESKIACVKLPRQ